MVMRFWAQGAFAAGLIKKRVHLVITVVRFVFVLLLQHCKRFKLQERTVTFDQQTLSKVGYGKLFTAYGLEGSQKSRVHLLHKTSNS